MKLFSKLQLQKTTFLTPSLRTSNLKSWRTEQQGFALGISSNFRTIRSFGQRIERQNVRQDSKRESHQDLRRNSKNSRRDSRDIRKNERKTMQDLAQTDEGSEEMDEIAEEEGEDEFERSPEAKLGFNGISLEHKKKKKVALVTGYVGTGYYGLQYQKNQSLPSSSFDLNIWCSNGMDLIAIESELLDAIYKAGGIRNSNYPHLQKLGWGRSSRTDKGVKSFHQSEIFV